MKTKLTKCLVMGALAIGMSSNVMADKNSSPDAQCNNATLKGRYLLAANLHEVSLAGEFNFNGDGTGFNSITASFELSKIATQNRNYTFNYTKDDHGECHFVLQGHPNFTLDLYVDLSGDKIAAVDSADDLPGVAAFYMYRDTQTTVRHK